MKTQQMRLLSLVLLNLLLLSLVLLSKPVTATEAEQKQPEKSAQKFSPELAACLLDQLASQSDDNSIKSIKENCALITGLAKEKTNVEFSNVEQRIAREISTQSNPNVITPHKRSYFLPFSYVDNPNNLRAQALQPNSRLDNLEAKFQISFKAPIFNQLVTDTDVLHFGFTIKSYWQMYNSEDSSPFRETNYQPEIIYSFLNDWDFDGWKNRVVSVGIEHQSNGRSQLFSRSWNRLYANFIFEKDDWVIAFRPWYRIPEDAKESPNAPDGDDNPDIEKFMGHFELKTIYRWDNQNISLTLRNNLRGDNKGAFQIDWSYPMGNRFKGYVQYFNGYGESLIDYDYSEQRLGFGVLLTDFF